MTPRRVFEQEQADAGVTAAQVSIVCVDGETMNAMIGYGDTCDDAYADAETNATYFCLNHDGVQTLTRVKCPYP